MAKSTFDITKFRKKLTEKMGIPTGFNDPKIWLDSGNYALNRLISGDYSRGVPLGKVTMFAGESGCLPESAKVKIRCDESLLRGREKPHINGEEIQIDSLDPIEKEITVGELK